MIRVILVCTINPIVGLYIGFIGLYNLILVIRVQLYHMIVVILVYIIINYIILTTNMYVYIYIYIYIYIQALPAGGPAGEAAAALLLDY